jgi:hypothetical protein
MASIDIAMPSTFGRQIRRAAIAAALAAATPLVIASVMLGTSAEAQIKQSCPKKMVAPCKKNFKQVCTKTDSSGCCTKTECQPN